MKTIRNLALFGSLLSLITLSAAYAGTTNAVPSSRATVRDGTYLDTDIDEATLGYVMAKFNTNNSAAKGYFEFDLTGLNPNTNATATFSVRRSSSSGAQHIRLWALNQAYSGMNNSITWNTAQANTAGNELLTGGNFTATPIEDRLVAGGVGNLDFTIPAPWGQYLFNNKIVLVFTGVEDAANNSSGFRVTLTNAPTTPRLTFSDTTGNLAPTITTTSNQTLYAYHTSSPIAFTVNDDTTAAASITLFAVSSDNAVVPTSNFVYSGQGISGSRTLTLTTAQAGNANVTVYVSDGTATNYTVFAVTVLPDPSISMPPAAITQAGTPVMVSYTVGDVDVGPSSLIVTGATTNPKVLASSNIVIGGSGATRTATVTPLAGKDGVAVVNLTVSDGAHVTSTTFPVMSLSSDSLLFADHFDYGTGNLASMSSYFWTNRVTDAVTLRCTNQQAMLRSSTSGESLVAPLAGSPRSSGVIYYGFRAMWTTVPGSSSGEFIHLYDSTGIYRAGRVYTLTNNTPGIFRLGCANITGPVEFPVDLTTNITYRIVVRYDIDGNENSGYISTRLWVDPVDSSSTSVDAFDSTSPISINQIGLRQNAGMGTILLDDLKASANFSDVLPPIIIPTQPVITSYAISTNRFVIDFTAGPDDSPADFTLLSSTNVADSYSPVSTPNIILVQPGLFRASPKTNSNPGFYRIRR